MKVLSMKLCVRLLQTVLFMRIIGGQGGIVIKKYPDRFLFVNPGYMLVPLEQYYKGGCSVPRNTTIQTMFSLLGYGEKAGSGSLRIMSAWASAHWRKPFISMTNRPDRVCLDLKNGSIVA